MASVTVEWQQTPPEACRHGVLTIGNFDGVHRGHAALLQAVHVQARALGVPAVALSFDPHPLSLLRPGQLPPPLTTLNDRVRLMEASGVEVVLLLHTTADLLALTAAEFFAEVIQKRLAVRALVEGDNFGFGRDRGGNVKTLADLGRAADIPLTVVPPLTLDGEVVSSSRVRSLLLSGDVAGASRLLDRPYRLHGKVGVGQKRGRTLGFPTANLTELETLAPGDGVYAVRVPLKDRTWPGAANVGPNPTFGEGARKIEVHLIGFTGDLYDQPLTVDFVQRLRDTKPFHSVAELTEQLRQDVERARQAAE